MTAAAAEKTVTIRESLLETLFTYERNHAHEAATKAAEARARNYLDVTGDPSSGSTYTVAVLRADTFRGLRAQIREHRWQSPPSAYSPTGRVYAWTCELLKVMRGEAGWTAVCIVGTHVDC